MKVTKAALNQARIVCAQGSNRRYETARPGPVRVRARNRSRNHAIASTAIAVTR